MLNLRRKAISRTASIVIAVIIIVGVAVGGFYAISVSSGTSTQQTTTTSTNTQAALTNVTFGFAGTPDVTDTPGFMFWQDFSHQVGLNLNVQYFEGDSTVTAALVAGSIQVAEGGFQSLVLADQAVGNSSGSYPFMIFANYEAVNDYALVVPNSITNWSQLANQPIAGYSPGSSSFLFCQTLLTEHGIPPSQQKCVGTGGGGARYSALIAGQVMGDVAEPFQIISAVATGKFHILASIPQQYPNIMFSVLYTSRAYATAHPTVITKISEAIKLADRWAQNETAWVAKEQILYPGTNVTIAATAWKVWAQMGLWQPNAFLSYNATLASENFLLNGGVLKSVLPPQDFVDLTYLQNAMSAIGTYSGGIIVDNSIPTIPITIPGFQSGSGSTSASMISPLILAILPVMLAISKKDKILRWVS